MELNIDVTWNNGKEKAVLNIAFDQRPEELFGMPKEELNELQKIIADSEQTGPKVIEQLEAYAKKHPKSMYAAFHLYRALEYFQFDEEREAQFAKIENEFDAELLTLIIRANNALRERDNKTFETLMKKCEVAKGLFPKRDIFYFEEALYFHSAWAAYFNMKKDAMQLEKHHKFIQLIINTRQSFLHMA